MNKYETIIYSNEDQQILNNTVLSKDELKIINGKKIKLNNKLYACVIENIYKFYKNNYSTSDLAEIYNVSIRQIQRIFKDIGINRDRIEAQQIVMNKIDYDSINKAFKKNLLRNLTTVELSPSDLEQHIRHKADLLLNASLSECEIIIGINSMKTIDSEINIPIIIINKTYLYKYAIEIANEKAEIKKKKDKNITAFYKGYTIFKINIKSYYDLMDKPEVRYRKEVENKLDQIINLIISEVSNNISDIRLE